jgi:branched-chain amino acid transport system ATP-binding protein
LASSTSVLAVRDLTIHFGGIVALEGVSFDVAEGQIVGLIGPNGAGKTTLFNCLGRLYTPDCRSARSSASSWGGRWRARRGSCSWTSRRGA